MSLSDSSWIRQIYRILNKTIVPEKNATEFTKTKVSHGMAEKGAVNRLGSQMVEMTLERGEEGARAKHIRHHWKTSQKFTQLPRVSGEEERVQLIS